MHNQIKRISDPLEVSDHWEFFEEGMHALNDPKGANARYTNTTFFQLLCRVTAMKERGLVFLVTSRNGKPLAFCVAFEAVTFMVEKCMYMVEIYSNGKSVTATKDAINQVERTARELGLKEIKTATRRFSGSSLRLFEEKWGFTREFQTFTKAV